MTPGTGQSPKEGAASRRHIDPVRRAVCPKCSGTDSRVDLQPWADDDRFTCTACGWVGGLSETLVESDSRAFNRRMRDVVRKILSANAAGVVTAPHAPQHEGR